MALLCTDQELPDIQTTSCLDEFHLFEECCSFLNFEDVILLFDKPSNSRNYYWFILECDESPLIVCRLEEYADSLARTNDWDGSRPDYLAIGWFEGECFVVILELTRTMVTESRAQEKYDQIIGSLPKIISHILPIMDQSEYFQQACTSPDSYKLVGAIIPPGRIHGIDIQKYSKAVTVNDTDTFITIVPVDADENCRLTWSQLLTKVGAATGRTSTRRRK